MTDRKERVSELIRFDDGYRKNGLVLAGMDEAGRGPLAGNVVAACVVMPDEPILDWIDDSKKLSEKRRESLYEQIISIASFWAVGIVSAAEIDSINILQATKKAMKTAADQVPADIFLIDAVKNISLKGTEIPLIKGDSLSYNIAAASIVAKVTRDRQMRELDTRYPEYGFIRNKGYGTREHIEAIRLFGPCPEHRITFIGHFL